ncbi:MAG: tyrosine-type recombinase/integrase [Afipia felis]|nr:tyrosine-type recombinase/integrase [Afipia felis]
MRLNRTVVKNLVLPKGLPYQIVWDDSLPGFGVKVNPNSKVWVVQYRADGKSRRETLGRTDTVSLETAREAAKTALARVQLGANPHAERQEAQAQRSLTLRKVIERYLSLSAGRLKSRSYEEVKRHLEKHWAPLHEMPIQRLNRSLISEHLQTLAQNNGPIASNRARAALSAVFSHAVSMGLVDQNAVVGTIRPGSELKRDRVLSSLELRSICDSLNPNDYGCIVKILLLTGQRREEVGDMRWSELNFEEGLWVLPRERTKNKRAHEVPLSGAAIFLLEQMPRVHGRDFVFGARDSGFSGWSKSKILLDRAIKDHSSAIVDWRLHDLRRTAATGMADLGVAPHIVEAVLNHVSGSRAGVAGIYNRASYREEKREALDRWADYLHAIIPLRPVS